MVTGATNGVGEAVARQLAAGGLTVTLVGRSDQRLAAARERITAAVPGAGLVLERADLAELDQVRDLTCRLLAGPAPEVVVSNAALVAPPERLTSDGLPRVLAVNHLAPYLLLRTLAERLDRARMVVVCSDPVSLAPEAVDLGDLTFARPERLGEPAGLRPYYAYARTKNMNVMFVNALARRLTGSSITVNGCHPGMVPGTGLVSEVPEVTAFIRQALQDGRLPPPSGWPAPAPREDDGRTPADRGADTPVWLAVSPVAAGANGRFYVDRVPVRTAPHTTDVARCERLWHATAALVGLPG
ncbi:MAG TPA: SDR family NAD(P)-dependent oxidoreductase [Nonomuraea sp.]|nr:SDR family NAD(P)-dependent oxidoreductase [Nonomuraea sp.]